MRLRSSRAPGPAAWASPGAFVLPLLLWSWIACETPQQLKPPAELELEDRTILLERGARVLEIQLGGTGGAARISPDSVEAQPGDVVRFVAADALTHAIGFDDAALDPEQRAFLEETNQLRSPPLLSTGSAWLVRFADAPPGRYPFHSLTQGGRGVVRVSER